VAGQRVVRKVLFPRSLKVCGSSIAVEGASEQVTPAEERTAPDLTRVSVSLILGGHHGQERTRK